MTEHRLGRRHAPDHRDAAYSAAPVLPASSTRRYRYWTTGITRRLDQGQTDSCVGHGWAHYLSTSPLPNPSDAATLGRITAAGWPLRTQGINPVAARIYDEAQLVDEFNDTPPAGGSSVRAGAKALQSAGIITDYLWLTGTDQINRCLLEVGPVVVGTDWYNSMFQPSPPAPGSGSMIRLDRNSGLAGGHCYLLTGVNLDTGRYRILNSWGVGWGNDGYAYMRITDMAILQADNGEACLTKEIL